MREKKSKVNKFYWILLQNPLTINQNARNVPQWRVERYMVDSGCANCQFISIYAGT